jgi:uncharacterized protein YidB (DUF937 family)
MGLFDSILDLSGGDNTQQTQDHNAISGIFDLFNHEKVGGLEGIVGMLGKGGLGNIVDSWINTGENQQVSTNQLSSALGNEVIGTLANKLGVSHGSALELLVKHLPTIIDKLTPDGKLPSSNQINVQDILGNLLSK